MFGLAEKVTNRDFAACSGCSLCLLVCPVWRQTRDLRYTPHGRAKALQHGVPVSDLADSIESCTLCGACAPACPENIDLVGMALDLRRQLPAGTLARNLNVNMQADKPRASIMPSAATTALVVGRNYLWNQALLARIGTLLGGARRIAIESDNGEDIALALEIGAEVPPQRIERFLAPLRRHKILIISDGLLLRSVRAWLPDVKFISLGQALSSLAPLRRQLRADDLYVIEPRAYHADHDALVRYYDDLRFETGCAMNLDLQRIAIPATMRNLRQRIGIELPDDAAQTHWLLQGRRIERIVVEDVGDIAAFEQIGNLPVVHLAESIND